MNLLLAALKKTEESGAAKRSLAELQLEEIQKSPSNQPCTQVDPLPGDSNNPIIASSGSSKVDSARAEEKNLFTAKKIAPNKRWQLGIIPISLIGGAIVTVVGSLYVYYQIRPSAHTPIATQNIAAPCPSRLRLP